MQEQFPFQDLEFGPLRPWSIRSLVQRSLELTWGSFGTIAMIATLVALPVFLCLNYFEPWTWFDEHQMLWKVIFYGDANTLFGALVAPAVLYAVAERMRSGADPGLGASLAWGLRRWPRLIGYRIAIGVFFLLGTLALVVPGVMVLLRYSLVTPLAGLDLDPDDNPMRRSAALVRGHAWELLGAAALLFAGVMVAAMVLSVANGFVLGLLIRLISDTPTLVIHQKMWVIESVGNAIYTVCAAPLTVLCLVVCLAWRREARAQP